jgi:hypothetical protein
MNERSKVEEPLSPLSNELNIRVASQTILSPVSDNLACELLVSARASTPPESVQGHHVPDKDEFADLDEWLNSSLVETN